MKGDLEPLASSLHIEPVESLKSCSDINRVAIHCLHVPWQSLGTCRYPDIAGAHSSDRLYLRRQEPRLREIGELRTVLKQA